MDGEKGMHFGRVDSMQGIDLTLPNDQVRTTRFLQLDWQGRQQVITGAPFDRDVRNSSKKFTRRHPSQGLSLPLCAEVFFHRIEL